jgi:TetR/AcrR family transcriptional regulator, ethionamide resistance regulator
VFDTVSNEVVASVRNRRDDVELRLLQAAEELLDEGASFASLKVEEIAQRAGIGRTGFYFYFADKRQLLLGVTAEAAEALYEQADRWWHGGEDGADELRRVLDPIVRLWLKHAAVLCAVVEATGYDEQIRGYWNGLMERFIEATTERIEREQSSGHGLPGPAHETAYVLCWMTERAMYQHARAGLLRSGCAESSAKPDRKLLCADFVR